MIFFALCNWKWQNNFKQKRYSSLKCKTISFRYIQRQKTKQLSTSFNNFLFSKITQEQAWSEFCFTLNCPNVKYRVGGSLKKWLDIINNTNINTPVGYLRNKSSRWYHCEMLVIGDAAARTHTHTNTYAHTSSHVRTHIHVLTKLQTLYTYINKHTYYMSVVVMSIQPTIPVYQVYQSE